MLFSSRQSQRRPAQGSNPSGERLLERVRGTAVAMLATAALFGVAVVAMISQQEFALLAPLPIQGTQGTDRAQVAGGGELAVSSAAALTQPGPTITMTPAASAVAFTPTDAHAGYVPASAAGSAGLENGRRLGASVVASPEPTVDSPPSDSSPQPSGTPGPTEAQPGAAPVPASGAPGKSGVGGPPSTAGTGEEGEGATEAPPAEEEAAAGPEPLPEVEPAPEPEAEPVPPAEEPAVVEAAPEAPGALPTSTVSVAVEVAAAAG